VQHSDATWGNLYVSNAFNEDFTLSLAKNLRRGGQVDFQRVLGLDGIYIANHFQLPNVIDENLPTELEEHRIRTVVTVDKGGSWETLPVPEGIVCPDPVCGATTNTTTTADGWVVGSGSGSGSGSLADDFHGSGLGLFVAFVRQLAECRPRSLERNRHWHCAGHRQRWSLPARTLR
jgi:hypothetical protein